MNMLVKSTPSSFECNFVLSEHNNDFDDDDDSDRFFLQFQLFVIVKNCRDLAEKNINCACISKLGKTKKREKRRPSTVLPSPV